ncbi:MAG: NnrS family protein [Bdellovibrionales bacterium]|nr:NnrS family protein [Bdellovibrionales bacterium]
MHPFLSYAFRPFFLFGTAFSAMAMALWVSYQNGWYLPPQTIAPTNWHAHEMLFGFVVAVIAGFLLTASASWEKKTPVRGTALLGLVVTWLLGRLVFLMPELSYTAVAVVDLLFLPLLIVALAFVLLPSAKPRNLVFLLMLTLLLSANALFHRGVLTESDEQARKGLLLGIDTVVLVMVLIGGRVIPLFTANAVKQVTPVKWAWAEFLSIGGVAAYLFSDFFSGESRVTGAIAIVAGMGNLVRLFGWGGHRTARSPILWVLHVGYLFIGIGLVLRGFSLSFGISRFALTLHLLMAGAMGTLVLGMVTRVALGHTGRPLRATAAIGVAYALVIFAALIRVFVPWLFPKLNGSAVTVAGILWCVAYGIYLATFGAVLARPRLPDSLSGQ